MADCLSRLQGAFLRIFKGQSNDEEGVRCLRGCPVLYCCHLLCLCGFQMYAEIGDFFRHRFVPHAGWAHSVLFCAELPSFKHLFSSLSAPPSPALDRGSSNPDLAAKQMGGGAGDDDCSADLRGTGVHVGTPSSSSIVNVAAAPLPEAHTKLTPQDLEADRNLVHQSKLRKRKRKSYL